MNDKKTITDLFQHALDRRKAQLTPDQQEKNRKGAENFLQAVSDVWNNRTPTPWAVNAMKYSGQHDELVKEIADRWERAFAELSAEEEKK